MSLRDRSPLRKGLPETILAYVAGVIEGDGTISISRSKTSHDVSLLITNGNLQLLDWIHGIVGGVIQAKLVQHQMGSAQQYQWKLRQGDVGEFCSAILPYLVGKRRQAELAIEVIRLRREWPGPRRPTLIRRRLQEIADECSWCNKRGWRSEESPYTEVTEVPEQAKLELVS